MRMISFLFVVLLSVQDNSAVQISGIVVDAAGQPVADVIVKVEDEPLRWQSGTGTRRDGRFVLSGLSPGTYTVKAEKAGFQQKDPALPASGIRYPGLTLTVVPNQPVENLRLQLIPADSIFSGRVLDENRAPLASVQVALLERSYTLLGSPFMSKIATATTNENGEYRIPGIGNGEYYLRVEFGPGTPTFLPTYYPGGTDSARAVPVTVSGSGQIWNTNLSVIRSKGYTVRMKLTSATSIPSTLGFTVMGVPAATHQAMGDDTHLFQNVPPGSYNISMSCPREANCAINQLVPVNVVDRDVDLGAVALKPGVSISGRIVSNGMLPERLAGSIVLDLSGASSGIMTAAGVSPDGTFSLTTVREGRHLLSIRDLPAGLYIEAVRYGGKDVWGSGLVIDGTLPQSLDVVISGPPGGVDGVVRNAKDERVPNIRVVLVPDVTHRANPNLYFLSATDQTGSFSISGVTPGDYSAFAWETAPNNAYRNAAWLKEYESQALRITVRRGLRTVADLRLIPSRR